ncbi:STAS domain-containing protein [Aeromicrobium sp. CFBP 8757]|uniref:STAS domain-containing protein n=1 Tax=Aeromicrobium sp. CFBP 8757 TaxID=2775288 RepID=UPI00177F609A|nr:STAS domain-containing protein [Aeromicrobium sp. CFBP 8757]MBD8608708.1 STAS domain-containing protein [Aeromicrobium sp. CFBP 8757]
MSLSIVDRVSGDFHVVELSGDIDVETARTLRAHIVDRFDESPVRLVIDLSDVAFMDSSGLGALVSGWQLTRDAGRFRIAGANPIVRRVLSITGLEDVFALYPTVEDATATTD